MKENPPDWVREYHYRPTKERGKEESVLIMPDGYRIYIPTTDIEELSKLVQPIIAAYRRHVFIQQLVEEGEIKDDGTDDEKIETLLKEWE